MSSKLPISQEDLKKILFEAKAISTKDWEAAEDNAHRRRRSIEEVLIERGFVNIQYLYELVGDKLDVPYVNLRKRKLDPAVLGELTEPIVKDAKAIPFSVNGQNIKVAFVYPKDKAKVALVKKASQKKVQVFLTSYKNVVYASRLYRTDIQEELNKILDEKILKVVKARRNINT